MFVWGHPTDRAHPTSLLQTMNINNTLLSCQKMCAQKAVVEKCGCLDISLPGHKNYPNLNYCAHYGDIGKYCLEEVTDDCLKAFDSFKHRIDCARNISRDVMSNTSCHGQCHCHPPCHEIKYPISYSLAKWPADSYDGDGAYAKIHHEFFLNFINKIPQSEFKKREMYANYFNISNRHEAKKQFTKLTLYLADSNVMKSEETEDYPQSELLSDIGGQMELWMGISLLSLIEVMQFAVHLLKYVSLKRNATRESDEIQKELEQGAKLSLTHGNHVSKEWN